MNKRQRQREAAESWWFNTKTNQAEFGLLTAAPYRIGPFATEAEANDAPALVRERSKNCAREEETDAEA
jgi:hypothetical protein